MHEDKLHILEQTCSCYAGLHKFNYACFLSHLPPATTPPSSHASYRWCSVLRSIPGCIHTSRPCRSRVRCSAGDKPVVRTRRPSSPRRSDSFPPHRCHVHHSPLRTALRDRGRRGVSQEEVKRKQIQELLSVTGRPRSTTLSDGQ